MAKTNTRGLGGGTIEDSSNDSETSNLREEIHGKLYNWDENMEEEEGLHNASSTTDVWRTCCWRKCRVGQRFLSEKKIQDAETQLSLENKTMNTTSKHVIKKDVEDKNQENYKSLRSLEKERMMGRCDEQDHPGKGREDEAKMAEGGEE